MIRNFSSAHWLFGGTLLTLAVSAMADAPPRNASPMAITPAMIQQALKSVPASKDLPYRLRRRDDTLETLRDAPGNAHYLPHGCTRTGGAWCFDYRSGYAVYKPMRKLLPAIPGMTPHNLSIRRGRIIAQYTFK